MKWSVWLHLGRSTGGKSPTSTHCEGGRTRLCKIGVGAGDDIVVATSTTKVWCSHTHRQNRYRGACKAVNFVSDAEQSTWLPCGIGGFICCVVDRAS